jgi:hypothetical protein
MYYIYVINKKHASTILYRIRILYNFFPNTDRQGRVDRTGRRKKIFLSASCVPLADKQQPWRVMGPNSSQTRNRSARGGTHHCGAAKASPQPLLLLLLFPIANFVCFLGSRLCPDLDRNDWFRGNRAAPGRPGRSRASRDIVAPNQRRPKTSGQELCLAHRPA